MMTHSPSDEHDGFDDDGFDDDFGADPFADVRDDASDASPAAFSSDDGADDPFDLEPVLEDDAYQNTPNSYNVRNIVLIAAGGFVLVLVAFLFSMGGGEEDGRLAVDAEAGQIPLEATPPDITMRPEAAGDVYAEEEDLSYLLGGDMANGGGGSYVQSGPAPRPVASAVSSSGAAASREPTYRDRRRDAFLSAIGRPSRRSVEQMPAGSGQPTYIVDALGNVIGPAPGAGADAAYGQGGAGYGANGLIQPASVPSASGTSGARTGSSWRPGPAGTPGGAAMRAANVMAQPEFSTFTLPKGTLINVSLETEVNSDGQGVFIARTVEDIYDRTRRHVLIPRGSQIVSTYSRRDVVGSRLNANVERLNLPDGRSVDFKSAGLYDAQGRRGLTDIVHRHTGSRLGAGLLQAATGIGSAVAGRRVRRETVLIRNPDGSTSEVPLEDDLSAEAAQRGANGANSAVRSATEETLSRPNTVVLRAGLRGVIVVEDDIDMGRPYYTQGAVPTGRSPYDVRPARRGAGAGPPQIPSGPYVPAPPPVRSTVRTVAAEGQR